MSFHFFRSVETIEVPCTIDMEQTTESLHAYVDLEGIKVRHGDIVTVHEAPIQIGFGEQAIYKRRATVSRAGWLEQKWIELIAHLELTELYEVSFSDRRFL